MIGTLICAGYDHMDKILREGGTLAECKEIAAILTVKQEAEAKAIKDPGKH